MNLKEIVWIIIGRYIIEVPVADWESVFVFLYDSWINFNVSTEFHKETAKPCNYNLKNIQQ